MPNNFIYVLCAILIVGGGLFIFLTNAIKIVPEYQRLVVFRLGRCVGTRGPGLILLIPIIDRAVKADLREQVREIPHQVSITKDNAPISIDFLWYYKVLDPAESVLQVGNFEVAAQGMATTTLRAVIGGIPLDDVRESPAAEVVHLLQKEGALVKAFEPFKPEGLPNMECVPTLEAAVKDADVLLLLVNHAQFRAITPEALRPLTSAKVLVDTVNAWDGCDWNKSGFAYHRLGVSKEVNK